MKHIHKYHKSPSTAGPQFPQAPPPQITGTNAGGASTTVGTTTTTMDENATTTGWDGSSSATVPVDMLIFVYVYV